MVVKMKMELNLIPKENRAEILRVAALIRDHTKADLIILFGKYVSGKMQSVLGGYEFLLLIDSKPAPNICKLHDWLNAVWPPSERIEPNIFIHSSSTGYVNKCNSRSYFYLNIRNEGIILHDSGFYNLFSRQRFKSTYAHREACKSFAHFFTMGVNFSDQAELSWEKGHPQMAAFHFFHATDLLLKTVEAVFYGDIIRVPNLVQTYLRVRHFSKELAVLFDQSVNKNRQIFKLLTRFYKDDVLERREITFTQKQYNYCLGKLTALQKIVKEVCKDHIAMLERCKNREISIDIKTPTKKHPPKVNQPTAENG